MIVSLLVGILALVSIAYAAFLIRTALAKSQFGVKTEAMLLGAVTNFFDTLGIGSFAPSIAWMRLRQHGARPADPDDHAIGLHPAKRCSRASSSCSCSGCGSIRS